MVELFIALALFGLMLSMIFSASEASIFSLSKIDLAGLKNQGLKEKYLNMIRNPEQLLFALLTGNELADYFASFAFASAITLLLSDEFRTPAFFIYSLFSFWLGDFFPKVTGFKFRTQLVFKIIPITYCLYSLLFPLRVLIHLVYHKINRLFPEINKDYDQRGFTPVEQIILHSIELGHKQGKISDTERDFIYGLFLSEKIEVASIMTPRSEIIALKDQRLSMELLTRLGKLPYNKFPVYKESIDEVIGVLYTKDLINYIAKNENFVERYLSELTRQAYFVPESFPVRDLLFEFQRKHLKIALVVDEYGTLKGLVTLEDILEELFGEILPEKEELLEPIQRISEGHFLLSGKAHLEEAIESLGIFLDEEIFQDLRTVNGFILTVFQGIPKEGDERVFDGWKFIIKKVRGRKILWVEAVREGYA
ncbi:MAG: hemolysin family protein [Caldimicrobium sp.]|nr:hemolysin family protein [Caldimicrobium sp.]MDW8183380.1 hemolysin family protein [Caldimicrobium sp.]